MVADPVKRVLLMASSMRGGGSERQVLMLAQRLDRSRFEPHLYLTDASGPLLEQLPDDVRVHAFNPRAERRWLYYPGRALRRHSQHLAQVIGRQRIDIVYDRTFHMTLLTGRVPKSVRRVATIVSPPHQAVPLVEQRFVMLKRFRLAAAYRKSDAVVAVSRCAAQSAEAYYCLPSGSVHVVYNGIDAAALAKRYGDPERPGSQHTTLVCVGRMTAEKGHADLIEALPRVAAEWPADRPPLKLRLIGDGALRQTLQSRAAALKLSDHVRFAGAVDDATQEIARADALVLPSHFEGLPNVVLEAMALGTPVIATRAGGTAELQGDTPTAFWAEPRDPASLAAAMLQYAHQPEQAFAQRDAAKRWVTRLHGLDQSVAAIERLLAGGSPS